MSLSLVIIGLLGIATYGSAVYQMLKEHYQPSFFSRGVWFLLGINTFAGVLMSNGSSSAKLLAGILFVGNLAVFITSYFKGSRDFGKVEKASLGLLVVSTIVIFGYDAPYSGLLVALFAHFIGGIPTLWRIIKDPHSEQAYHWYFFFTACIVTILSSGFNDVKAITMPLYFAAFDILIISLVNRKHFVTR